MRNLPKHLTLALISLNSHGLHLWRDLREIGTADVGFALKLLQRLLHLLQSLDCGSLAKGRWFLRASERIKNTGVQITRYKISLAGRSGKPSSSFVRASSCCDCSTASLPKLLMSLSFNSACDVRNLSCALPKLMPLLPSIC
jgi:hypothetical protein